MNIIYSHHIFSCQIYGGISRYFVNLISSLDSRDGVNPLLIAPLYINNYLDRIHDSSSFVGFHVPKLNRYIPFLLNSINNIVLHTSSSFFSPDIFHLTYYTSGRTPYQKSLTVLTVYDMIHELYPNLFSQKDITSKLKYKSVSNADHIITISHNTKSDLVRLFNINPNKISVVHLGFSPLPDTCDSALVKDPYILYVGQRSRHKNFRRLVQAFKSSSFLVNNFKLCCFGGGSFSVDEMSFIKSGLDIQNSILHFTGPDTILSNLYKHASLFVYPSIYEGFGLPPLEALSLNCPVVASNTSSIPEVLGKSAHYFDPLSIDSISSAILDVVNSPSLQNKLMLASTSVLQKFTWDNCTSGTFDVYQSL